VPRLQSLRFRIASAYIVGALAVSGAVAGGTFFISQWVLTRQAIANGESQSYEELRFLRDRLVLDEGPGKLRVYLRTLQQRGSDVIAMTGDSAPAASTSIGLTERSIPKSLRAGVEAGRVGFAIVQGVGHRQLVFGSRVPEATTPIYTYFFYSLETVDRTMDLLWRVLLGVVGVAGAIAAAVGLRLADRTIRPLREAATAARRVAEGGLETRLEEAGEDELAQLARSFNLMTTALEERISRERQFISDVSHELRTPLTALKTSIDFVAERLDELPQRLRPVVGLAADEVDSLRRLVDDLLELSRADAGSVQVSLDDLDLRNFATEIARRRAPSTHVEIDGPEVLLVRTDKMRLERVVGNLLENAVVHGGGEDVRITLDTWNGAARISVADQGPGIDEDKLPRIFDRFFRGDEARGRDTGTGAGLGLAIASENARLLGADLHVESLTGQGTRFVVVLPHEVDA
jgi:two-component system sensor histidine kinase MtrB